MLARDTPSARKGSPAHLILGGVLALFVTFIALLAVAAVTRRSAPEFTPAHSRAPTVIDGIVHDTVTLDARDERAWQFFDFDTGAALVPPDTAGWDIGVRRFHVITAGRAADMGPRDFATVPLSGVTGLHATTSGREPINPALDRWYVYNFLSHLLEPKDHVYLIETREGRYAKLAFVSYYCPRLSAGCVTFRYAFQPEAGVGPIER